MTEISLTTPLGEEVVRKLRVGDLVAVTGTIVTARDRAHAYLAGGDVRSELPFDLAGGVIYHCGPIARRTPAGLTVVSAGPTTSGRMAPYEAAVVERYGVRALIGKGGLPEELLDTFAAGLRLPLGLWRLWGAVRPPHPRGTPNLQGGGVRLTRSLLGPGGGAVPGHRQHGRPRREPAPGSMGAKPRGAPGPSAGLKHGQVAWGVSLGSTIVGAGTSPSAERTVLRPAAFARKSAASAARTSSSPEV